jgi:hypothetical protein
MKRALNKKAESRSCMDILEKSPPSPSHGSQDNFAGVAASSYGALPPPIPVLSQRQAVQTHDVEQLL